MQDADSTLQELEVPAAWLSKAVICTCPSQPKFLSGLLLVPVGNMTLHWPHRQVGRGACWQAKGPPGLQKRQAALRDVTQKLRCCQIIMAKCEAPCSFVFRQQ